MSEPKTQVVFRYNLEDVKAFWGMLSAWKRFRTKHAAYSLVLASGAPPVLALVAWGNSVGAAVSGTMVLAMAIWLVFLVRRAFRKTVADSPELTVAISPEGVTGSSTKGWGAWSWSSVTAIERADEHLLIHVEPETLHGRAYEVPHAIVVPQRAFASQQEMDQFVDAVQRFRETAGGAMLDALLATVADEEDAAAVEVRYHNTPADYVIVCEGKLRPPATQGKSPADGAKKGPSKISAVVWGLIVVALAMFLPHDSTAGDIFGGVLLVGFVMSVELLVLFRVLRWMRRRRFRKMTFPSTTLRISPGRLLFVGERNASFCPWSEIGNVWQSPDGIALANNQNQVAHYIPKSAFADPEQAERLAERMNQYRDAETARREAEGKELPPYAESGNPFQSPMGGF